MSDNLYLFANNNSGQAENNGSYRLYDMKIEGDSEGVESGVNYVDYITNNGENYLDTGLVFNPNYKYVMKILSDGSSSAGLFGHQPSSNNKDVYFYYNPQTSLLCYGKARTYDGNLRGNAFFIGKEIIFDRGIVSVNDNILVDCSATMGTESSTATITIFKGKLEKTFPTQTIRLYYWKVYNGDILVQDLRPCLDTEGIPCVYDEVSKKYLYNQGTGTFGYKKTLRDFQPVLDSNNVPCLLDKIKNKFYYDKNGNLFNTKEKVNGYRKLAYLQGDGASWINTNFSVQDIMGYDMEIKCENPSNDAVIFGFAGTDISNRNKLVGLLYRENLGWYIYGSCESHTHNDLLFTLTNFSNSILDKQIITLFGNGGIYTGDSKIYYAKLFDENDNLVFHAIPVLDQDNVPCMYDKVSDTFFYNQGTGEFSYGIEELDASDENYTPIEYIESTGTQYIDTEVVPTSNTDIEMTCRVCDYNETPTLTNSYIMNGLQINNNTYQYNSIDTTVQPNLVASTGATLTMGSTNLALLDEDDIETATNNGWSLV